jgi:transposase
VNRKSTPAIPEAILQLQRQLDQFRSTQPRRTKLPESLWQAAVELARQYGVYSVAHPLRLDYTGLKKRLGGVPILRRKATKPAFVELIAHPVEGIGAARLGEPAARLAGSGRMIQIAPQIRILVAVEAIDGRKGIDAIAQLCREKLNADPFSGYLFIFRTRRGTAIRILQYDGQGFWLATKRLSKGRFKWWPTGAEPARTLRAHQAQLLLAAGNPEAEAPPAWRPLSS